MTGNERKKQTLTKKINFIKFSKNTQVLSAEPDDVIFTILKEFKAKQEIHSSLTPQQTDIELLKKIRTKDGITQTDMEKWQWLINGKILVTQSTISRHLKELLGKVYTVNNIKYRIVKNNDSTYYLVDPKEHQELQLRKIKSELKKHFKKDYLVNISTQQTFLGNRKDRPKSDNSKNNENTLGAIFIFRIDSSKSQELKNTLLEAFCKEDIFDIIIVNEEDVVVILNSFSKDFPKISAELNSFFKE